MKIRSRAANFGLSGIASRILLSLFIVFGTYNPSGRSFYHWVLADGPITPRILVGLLLFGTYASLLYATWELIGFAGMLLVIGICISAAYMLEQANLISFENSDTRWIIALITLGVTMGWGMSYSLLFARLTGIQHARATLQ
jgi:Family of unknown function (DUF6524)